MLVSIASPRPVFAALHTVKAQRSSRESKGCIQTLPTNTSRRSWTIRMCLRRSRMRV